MASADNVVLEWRSQACCALVDPVLFRIEAHEQFGQQVDIPLLVETISPASFEHEYPGKAGLFWVRHEHIFQQKAH
jgi:hypothetical protein